MTYMPPVDDVKAYARANGVRLFDAVKALRQEHNRNHTPEPNHYRFAVCKRGHTAMHQRYCTVCGRAYCEVCQAEAAAIRARGGKEEG